MPTASSTWRSLGLSHRLRRQRQHGDQAALAVVVGAQHEHTYLMETMTVSVQKNIDRMP
jgi:hypothetical protein